MLTSDILGNLMINLNSIFTIAKLNIKNMLLEENIGDCEVYIK